MRWVAFGTYDVRRHPRVAVLIEGLRASGDEVVEINEPLRLDTAGRVALLRQPWRLPPFVAELARCWLTLAVRGRRAQRRAPSAVLVGYLGHFDVRLARRLFQHTPIALDHLVSAAATASDRGLAGTWWRLRLMRAIDQGALRRADVVIVDTAEHAAGLPAHARARAVVAPVGATAEWFAYGAARRRPAGDTGPLRVIFVGLFTPLHGTHTLGAAVAALAGRDDIEFTIVGTGQEYATCRALAAANPHVTWIDWVPAERLPALVGAHEVSLGIFGTTAKALRVVPTKVFQAAAAGCAVVTSSTGPQRQALPEHAVFVPPGDPGAVAATLVALAGDRHRVARLGMAAHQRALAQFTSGAVVADLRRMVAGLAARPLTGR